VYLELPTVRVVHGRGDLAVSPRTGGLGHSQEEEHLALVLSDGRIEHPDHVEIGVRSGY
jgi:hypothetical protein